MTTGRVRLSPGEGLAAAAVLAAALAYRLWLTRVYAGWEESDYGNLAMTWEALNTRFSRLKMEYMPLYYVATGSVTALTGDARLSAVGLSLAGGMAALAAAMAVAARLFGARIALIAGAYLAFQPEFSLYASTSLREPFFGGLVWCGIAALVYGRTLAGASLVSASFLVRFDSMFSNVPVVLWHAFRQSGRRWRAVAAPAAITLGTIAAWSLYCRVVHGTFAFFSGPVGANLANGGIAGVEGALAVARQGVETVWALLTHTLPRRVGWPFLLLSAAGAALLLREGRGRWPATTLLLFFALDLGFWLGVGFIGQHHPDHNLYWKWLFPVVPHFAVLGAFGAASLVDRFVPDRTPLRVATWGALAVSTALTFAAETEFQVVRSRAWYGPQRELARWVEERVPPGSTLLMDGIPWGWIARRDHPYTFLSWADVELPPGDRDLLGAWLDRKGVDYVLWFREDWAREGNAAAFLEHPVPQRAGRFWLMPLRDEPEYGFVFYRVDPAERHPGLSATGPGGG